MSPYPSLPRRPFPFLPPFERLSETAKALKMARLGYWWVNGPIPCEVIVSSWMLTSLADLPIHLPAYLPLFCVGAEVKIVDLPGGKVLNRCLRCWGGN